MSSQPLVLVAKKSKVNVCYNADLIIDDDGMRVEQLIQTNKGMKLFDSNPKMIRSIRKTIDSELETQDLTDQMENQNPVNNYGQYIRIQSHYKFDDGKNSRRNRTDSSSLSDEEADIVLKSENRQQEKNKNDQILQQPNVKLNLQMKHLDKAKQQLEEQNLRDQMVNEQMQEYQQIMQQRGQTMVQQQKMKQMIQPNVGMQNPMNNQGIVVLQRPNQPQLMPIKLMPQQLVPQVGPYHLLPQHQLLPQQQPVLIDQFENELIMEQVYNFLYFDFFFKL